MELDFSTPQICLFLGKPKRGKSYALRWNILKQTVDEKQFKYGIVFTKTKFNGDYTSWLPEEYVYEGYDPMILQQYLDGLKELDPSELQPSFIVFDDIQGLISGQDPVFTSLIANHRHYKISIHISLQYIYGRGSTPVLRECVGLAFLFNSKGKRTIEALYENFGQLFDSLREFKEYFLECTKPKYTAMLYIQDVDNKDENYLQFKCPSPKEMKHVKDVKLDY